MVQEDTGHAQSCMVTDLYAHTNNEERRPLGRDGGDGFLPEMGRCDAEKAAEQVRGTIMPSIWGIFQYCQMNYCGAAEKRSNSLLENLLESPTDLRNDKNPRISRKTQNTGVAQIIYFL